MPVIARLSKRLYDALGEDAATELLEWLHAMDLSYRTELRGLNELNFARFDAKLEQRVAELRQETAEFKAEIRREIAEFRQAFSAEGAALREDHSRLRSEFAEAMAKQHASMVRWMFGFWVGTIVPLVGLVLALRGL